MENGGEDKGERCAGWPRSRWGIQGTRGTLGGLDASMDASIDASVNAGMSAGMNAGNTYERTQAGAEAADDNESCLT